MEKFKNSMNFQVFDAAIFKIATWQATMNIELAVHSCICGWEGCSLGEVRGQKKHFFIPQKSATRTTKRTTKRFMLIQGIVWLGWNFWWRSRAI